MLRTLRLAVVAVLVTVPLAGMTTIVAMFRSTSSVIDWLARTWARSLVAAAGIDLHVENVERLDRGKRYIIVANHYSYLDIPCLFAGIPQPIRFMAKASLFKIPIFGWSLSRAGFIPIDRKNRRTAVKSFDLAADRIRKGNTIAIFPEEGRSRTREMKPFQRGAFLLAIKSQKTIIPIAIDSTFDIWPVGAFWKLKPGRVTLRVGTPIETATLTVREKDRLLRESNDQIQRMLFGDTAQTSHPEK
ncbi:MAG TPA: lysophospholipid acyltransferase family protein [Thermoanaerobaculia bacterium]|jgi:1-acyl-sn-glycerol-3-phosphate acyltransferase|nr:lysophospholipid acyltransferase family protein [Thermoanaerobaculia bacterium]